MPSAEPMSMTLGASTFERNLAVLSRGSPDAAARVRLSPPRPDARVIATDDGVPAIELVQGASAVALCSRRRPLDEARRLIEPVDIADAAIFVVLGFGAGYHVAELARKVGRSGLIVVFEPDVALLRTAMEQIDHSGWMAGANTAILTDPDDAGAMAAAVQGLEGLVALGVKVIPHPASEGRLAPVRKRFDDTFNRIIEALTLTARTSLFQSKVTLRNLIQNAEHYVLRGGSARYRESIKGRPAVFVAAGPSLERNLDLLAQPGVCDRVVIIAVQTVLKTMLARGIRPHFVTALDYSELSLRFYEGLTKQDVEGVTLIIEPKVNRGVADAFPGEIVCVDDKHLNTLLGSELVAHRGENGGIVPCATVAHLAYHWARFLGCDPVAVIGQDLGFTDGLYYASGAAIHDTWAGELNEFNTLEMLEWQRIKRMGPQLMPAADASGRPLYTDRQMNNYRVQFERDFKADAERGLRTFDCTEGGVAKGHTRACTLAEFLATHAKSDAGCGRTDAQSPAGTRASPSRAKLQDRLRAVRRDVWRIGEASRRTAVLLSEMSEHHGDQARVNRLIKQVYTLRDEVMALEPAFTLVQLLDQQGGLSRIRADRAINLDATLPPMERQLRQIDRDAENVRSLAAAADELGAMLDLEIRAMDGARRDTRDADLVRRDGDVVGMGWVESDAKVTAAAVIPVASRDLEAASRDLVPGMTVLGATLARLARCETISRILLLAGDERAVRAAMGTMKLAKPVEVLAVGREPGAPEFVRAARLAAGACWRGGLGGATVFDEALDPAEMAPVMERLGIDAAVVVGPAWCCIDPAICDELVRRHAQNPEQYRYVFSTAAPGLGACVISRKMMGELARLRVQAGVLGTLGAVLGYLPPAPMADPLGSRVCIGAAPVVRDAGFRFIADSRAARERIGGIARALGGGFIGADAAAIVRTLADSIAAGPFAGPSEVELLVEAARGGAWRNEIIRQACTLRDDVMLTISGALRKPAGQPREEVLLDPALPDLVRTARSAGCRGVHVRTGLRVGPEAIDALLKAGPDVISVDLLAETPGVYGAVAGEDAMALAWAGTEHLMRSRGQWPLGESRPGAWRGWIVPRMTKCDASHAEMERFYDRWIMLCGWAVIDPLHAPAPGQRIAPLRTPRSKAARDARSKLVVQASGEVLGPDGGAVSDLSRQTFAEAWERLWAARRTAGLI